MEIEKIIEQTVERIIARLTITGALRTDQAEITRKTEELLERYTQFQLSDQPYTRKVLAQINDALNSIKDDPYYSIIPMYYFDHVTRFGIAEYFGVTERTITRHRIRLVSELSSVLFSDDVILKILS